MGLGHEALIRNIQGVFEDALDLGEAVSARDEAALYKLSLGTGHLFL